MKKKKFSFLELDDDNFVKSVHSKNDLDNDDEDLKIAKKSAEIIEKNFQRKIIEKKLEHEVEKIKNKEKEVKKINDEYEAKRKKIKNLEFQDFKLKNLEDSAKKLKIDYDKEKESKDKKNVIKNFENDYFLHKIKNTFSKNEKLVVKTNIYLKKNIYEKVNLIYKETGKSRSSIINTLIEIGIKNLE